MGQKSGYTSASLFRYFFFGFWPLFDPFLDPQNGQKNHFFYGFFAKTSDTGPDLFWEHVFVFKTGTPLFHGRGPKVYYSALKIFQVPAKNGSKNGPLVLDRVGKKRVFLQKSAFFPVIPG